MTETTMYVLKRFPRLSETFVLREILALEDAGMRVVIDALREPDDEPRHDELRRLRAPVRYLAGRPRLRDGEIAVAHVRVAGRAPVRWLAGAVRAMWRREWRRFVQAGCVADRTRREGATHVHAHFATAAATVAGYAGFLAGVPVSVTAHAKDIFHADNAPHVADRLRGVDTVVTVSEYNVRHLRSVLAPGQRVRHVPNAVPIAAPVDRCPSGPVLCVSRLVAKKGVDTLMRAASIVARSTPDLAVEVIGTGPLAGELADLVDELGLGGHVRLVGAKTSTEVDAAYRACSMVVLACRIDEAGDRDGLPTVLVEAMARALPVISTAVVGIGELVRPDETGLLVQPDDPDALAEAILRIQSDPELASRLGGAARRHVMARHEPSCTTEMLRSVFTGGRR